MTLVTGDTLAELNVPVPGYDRRQVTTGIVYRTILTSLLDQGVRKTLADLDHYREDSP